MEPHKNALSTRTLIMLALAAVMLIAAANEVVVALVSAAR